MSYYMLSIKLPETFSEDLEQDLKLQLEQKEQVDDLMQKGVITSFHLSADRSRCWMMVKASSDEELDKMLADFVLIEQITVHIHELAFSQNVNVMMPQYSLN